MFHYYNKRMQHLQNQNPFHCHHPVENQQQFFLILHQQTIQNVHQNYLDLDQELQVHSHFHRRRMHDLHLDPDEHQLQMQDYEHHLWVLH